jgi:DtxR family manganese transport transcriptional regulator
VGYNLFIESHGRVSDLAAPRHMAKPQTFADRHRRIRSDHATETAEDYVEAIEQVQREQGKCRIVDLARRFDVSHVTVTKVVGRLKREGLVVSEPYGPLELTEAGRQLAAKSRRQHEIVYDFLRAIGVSDETAAIDAEGIEHHVSRQTLDCLRRLTEELRSRA